MIPPRIIVLFSICIHLTVVFAKIIVIDGADPQIKYYTGTNPDSSNATWTTLNRSPDSCDTPQQLTERVGDYATFTFTGTGVFVLGTVGVKRGILGFSFDGQNVTFDRTTPQLQCDQVLFQKTNLPFQQHTVIATLAEKQTSFVNGKTVGVLSIQRIRYTVPGGEESGSKLPLIIGASVGGAVAIALAFGIVFFLRRRRRVKRNHQNAAFFDADDVPSRRGGAHHPAMIATPFQWDGPPSHRENDSQSTFPPTREIGYQYPDSHPNSPKLNDPLLDRRASSVPSSNSRSRSDDKRESKIAHRDSKASYFAHNSDPRQSSGYGGPASPPVGEDQLVDRIALRLADIMESRAGPSTQDAPPMYDPGQTPPIPLATKSQPPPQQPFHSLHNPDSPLTPSSSISRPGQLFQSPPPSSPPDVMAFTDAQPDQYLQQLPSPAPKRGMTLQPQQLIVTQPSQEYQPWNAQPGGWDRQPSSGPLDPPSPPPVSYAPPISDPPNQAMPYNQQPASSSRRPLGPRTR